MSTAATIYLGLKLMALGMSGVFVVLIIFMLIIRALTTFLPEKPKP